jgi:hypothetical protein
MLSLKLIDIPEYLHNSEFYNNLDKNDEDEIVVPKECFKSNDYIYSLDNFTNYIKTANFWCLHKLSDNFYEFILKEKNIVVCTEQIKQIGFDKTNLFNVFTLNITNKYSGCKIVELYIYACIVGDVNLEMKIYDRIIDKIDNSKEFKKYIYKIFNSGYFVISNKKNIPYEMNILQNYCFEMMIKHSSVQLVLVKMDTETQNKTNKFENLDNCLIFIIGNKRYDIYDVMIEYVCNIGFHVLCKLLNQIDNLQRFKNAITNYDDVKLKKTILSYIDNILSEISIGDNVEALKYIVEFVDYKFKKSDEHYFFHQGSIKCSKYMKSTIVL